MGRPEGGNNWVVPGAILTTHAIDVLSASGKPTHKANIYKYLRARFGIDMKIYTYAMHNARTKGWIRCIRGKTPTWETTEKGDWMLIDFERVSSVVIGIRKFANVGDDYVTRT